MEKRKDATKILNKRFWLLQNLDYVIEQSAYHKEHRGDVIGEKIVVWRFDQEEAQVYLG